MKELLITGATGSLAPFLIHELLHEAPDAHQFTCLVRRADAHESLRTRMAAICSVCADRVVEPRFQFVRGDLSQPISYTGSPDAVWHFAADLRMDDRVADAVRTTNLSGAQNILDFSSRANATLYYVSTAYVAGCRTGRVTEQELFCGQQFRNPYEESKAQCEELVRKWLQDHPGVVFRPSVVVGDSKTGISLGFHNMYKPAMALWLMRKAAGLAPDAPLEFEFEVPVFSSDTLVNLVALDYTTKLLLDLSRRDDSLGKTFHVANPTPPTVRSLFDATMAIMNVKGMRLVDEGENTLDRILEKAKLFPENLVNLVRVGIPYVTDDHAHFDMSNVEKAYGVMPPHPTIDQAMLARFYQYASERNFRSFS